MPLAVTQYLRDEIHRVQDSDLQNNIHRRLRLELRDPFGVTIFDAYFLDYPAGIGTLLAASQQKELRIPFDVVDDGSPAKFYIVLRTLDMDTTGG